jgi:hypothetical protein
MAKIWGMLVLVACGDPAAPFLGTWRGSESVTFSGGDFGAGSTQTVPSVQEVFSVNAATGDVEMSECSWGGPVVDGRIQFRAAGTPCDTTDSSGCVAALNLAQGSGAVRGSSLTVDVSGAIAATCPGQRTVAGDYALHADLTRQ